MVKSATDAKFRTAPPKPQPYFRVMGSIPVTDEDFIEWREDHCIGRSVRDAMLMYIEHINAKGKIIYDQQEEVYEAYLLTLKQTRQQTREQAKAKGEPQSAIAIQIIHPPPAEQSRPQNISPSAEQSLPQNISPSSEQSLPQNNSSPAEQSHPQNISPPQNNSPPLEQPLLLNIPPPSGEQIVNPPGAPRSPSSEIIDTNKLTMQQALELFELLQARKSKEVDKAVTVEAEPVARAPARAEPLSYLTLGTVEGIVGSVNPDELPEQTPTWEGKMEKFMRLSHTYSSDNTISGEKCYMVDEALYKDILLAVAARRQNECTLSSASEKLEQHLGLIEDSHKRVIQRENDAIEQFVEGITLSQEKIRAEHTARMGTVMAEIRTLKNSLASSAEMDQNSQEVQRLRFQVAQYEGIVPVYQSRLKDTEEQNKSWTRRKHI